MATKQVEIRWLSRVFGRNELAALAKDGRDAAKAQDEFATSAERAAKASKRAASELQAASSELRKGSDALKGATSGLGGDASKNVDNLTRSLAAATNGYRLMGIAAAAAGLSGAGIATAAFRAASNVANRAEQEQNTAERTGLSIRDVGLFSQLANNAGVNANAFTTSIKGLSKALSENSDEGQKAKRTLADLGITTRDAFGAVLPTRELFLNIADSIGKIEDPAKRAEAATKILGRAGIELLPLFRANARDAIAELEKLGVGFDERGAAAALRFDGNLDRLNTKLDVLKRRLGETLAEGINPFLEALDGSSSVSKSGRGAVGLIDFILRANVKRAAASATPNLTDAELEAFLRQQQAKTPGLGGVPGVSDQQLAASDRSRRERNINAILTGGGGVDALQRQLSQAQKDLSNAQAEADDKGVQLALNRVTAIKSQIEAIREAEAATKQAETTVQNFIKNSLDDGLSKFDALSVRGGQVLGLTGRFPRERLDVSEALERQLRNELFKESGKAFERSAAGRRFTTPLEDEVAAARAQLLADANRRAINLQNDSRNLATGGRQFVPAQIEIDPRINQQRIEAFSERRVRAVQATLQYEERIATLTAGPGGQVAAINRIAELRVRAARDEYAITKDLAALQEKTLDAARERTVALLELAQRQRDSFAQGAGQLFVALKQNGGGGVGDFFRSQLDNVQRKVVENTASIGFGALQKSGFQLPGVGSASNPTFLGRILDGTPFGPNALNDLPRATTDNTKATIDNTAALRALGLGGGSVGSTGGSTASALASIPSIFGGTAAKIPSGIFQGGLGPVFSFGGFGSGPTTFGNPRAENILNTASNNRASATLNSSLGTNQIPSGGSTATQRVAQAGQIAAGGLIAFNGFRQGGPRGNLQGVAGVLGAAAAIPGPQQPFLLAGSIIAGFVGSIIPDPRKIREGIIESTLKASKVDLPTSSTIETDLFGRSFDYGARGEVRIVNNWNVQAWDSKSFIDNRDQISEAVRVSMSEGNPIVQEIRSQVVA